ncbi:hypothetical protein L873DRAFT_1837009 [Choiromyces venosus 120613-1]|uniref:Uncharacterized protein n=1 Tax=Choiromyces venosus 120613-1 TaxID=1336337 RepID=A0A3N4JC95_9PEZI|nr:hypothetical protein L873DRAFT_1837009 [Choiromyces venosus 120613-1]
MYNRRRGRSSSSKQPAQPTSAAALIAATAVYRPNTSSPDPHLAAAAAGAALRHVTVTPTPPGTIQTKRMLQRRESYSSVTPPSDSENGPRRVQRSHSTSSLTERRFRKPKPLPPPSPPVQQQQYYQRSRTTNSRPKNKGNARGYFPSSSSSDDDDSEEDSNIRRSASVRSTSSNPSFPPTPRGPAAPDRKRSKPKHASPTKSMLSHGSLRDPKPASPSFPDRFHRRSSEPDLTVQSNRRKNQLTNGNVYQAEYSESVSSITGSDLGSIAEEDGGRTTGRTVRKNVPSKIMEEDSEDQDDTFNFRRRDKIGVTRRPSNKVYETSSIPIAVNRTTSTSPTRKRDSILSLPPNSPERTQSHRREHSPSPSRTHFSLHTTDDTSTKHSPPPRSVSPAKSALKHRPVSPPPIPPIPANVRLDSSPSSPSGRKPRVSFSDEDSVASFTNGRAPIPMDSTAPPALPVFGSIRRTGRDAPQNVNAKKTTNNPLPPAIYSISPPPSSSSREDLRLEQQRRTDTAGSPDGRLGFTPPETSPSSSVLGRPVPELVLVIPTPREEKDECETMGSGAQVPVEFSAGESSSANAATQAREDRDNDSDGASIYSDACEDLEESIMPSIMQVADSQEAPSSSSPVPHTQPQPSATDPPSSSSANPQNGTQTPQTRPTKTYKKESPPLPPDFIPTYTYTTTSPSSSRRPQAPIRTHTTSSSSTDTASITSISSFKRAHPRQPRTSMRSTMRSDPPPPPPTSSSRPKPAPLHKQKPKQMKSTLRGTSRIPDSSDDEIEDEYQRPTFQSRFADSDDEVFVFAAGGASAGGKAKLRRKRTDSSAFLKKEKKGFWSMFGKKEKKEGKAKAKEREKEKGVISSTSNATAPPPPPPPPAVIALPPPAPPLHTTTKPTVGTGVIRKQKPWAGPDVQSVSVRIEGPPPKPKKKNWMKKLFSPGKG